MFKSQELKKPEVILGTSTRTATLRSFWFCFDIHSYKMGHSNQVVHRRPPCPAPVNWLDRNSSHRFAKLEPPPSLLSRRITLSHSRVCCVTVYSDCQCTGSLETSVRGVVADEGCEIRGEFCAVSTFFIINSRAALRSCSQIVFV